MASSNVETAAQAIDDVESDRDQPTTQPISSDDANVAAAALQEELPTSSRVGIGGETNETNLTDMTATDPSLASKQLAAGLLQIFEPPVDKMRNQLKELINKQNKIYIDLSAQKFKLDSAEVSQMQELMDDVKICREKLIRIKKQMLQIHQRTESLKKRAAHIETCKQKELQKKLQRQQQEESLIGNQ